MSGHLKFRQVVRLNRVYGLRVLCEIRDAVIMTVRLEEVGLMIYPDRPRISEEKMLQAIGKMNRSKYDTPGLLTRMLELRLGADLGR